MKTSTAILSHSLVGLAQAGSAAAPGLPWWAQLLIQVGLMVGQAVIARKNSTSDASGAALPK